MIVVEGPDGAGKTTLIEKIKAGTGLEVAPRVVSKDTEPMVDLKMWVEENVWRGWQNTIFDRHRLISEPIYGPIIREKLEPGFDDIYWFYEVLDKFWRSNPYVIFCMPPLQAILANLTGDPDNEVVNPHIRQVWGAYRNIMVNLFVTAPRSGTGRLFHYDYTSDFQDREVNRIIRTINRKIESTKEQ